MRGIHYSLLAICFCATAQQTHLSGRTEGVGKIVQLNALADSWRQQRVSLSCRRHYPYPGTWVAIGDTHKQGGRRVHVHFAFAVKVSGWSVGRRSRDETQLRARSFELTAIPARTEDTRSTGGISSNTSKLPRRLSA